jgi:hypothetical protein
MWIPTRRRGRIATTYSDAAATLEQKRPDFVNESRLPNRIARWCNYRSRLAGS